MQSDEDARRDDRAGAPAGARGRHRQSQARVRSPDPAGAADLWRRLLGLAAGQPVWIAGSTHRGEDEAVLRRASSRAAPSAPAGPGAGAAAPRAGGRGDRRWSARSGFAPDPAQRAAGRAAAPVSPVIVLDTVGELAQLYSIADVVFVGGSLVPLGGHNMLEPALRGKPVLFGPHTTNFREAAASCWPAAARQVVRDAGELAAALCQLLGDPPLASACAVPPPARRSAARHGAVAGHARSGRALSPSGGARRERTTGRFTRGWERGFSDRHRRSAAALAGSYRGLLGAREWLYARGVLHGRALGCPVVSIGNLTVGGTGKTPAVELAVRTLTDLGHRPGVRQPRLRPARQRCAGRRRRRRRSGSTPRRRVTSRSSSRAGCPACPWSWGPTATRRARGPRAVRRHRRSCSTTASSTGRCRKDLEIVMARAATPWGNGRLLPGGPLREPLGGLSRAHLVVATGARELLDAAEVAAAVARHAPSRAGASRRCTCRPSASRRARMRFVPLAALAGARLLAFAGIATPAGIPAYAGASAAVSAGRTSTSSPTTTGTRARSWRGWSGGLPTAAPTGSSRPRRTGCACGALPPLQAGPLYVLERAARRLTSGEAAWRARLRAACRAPR